MARRHSRRPSRLPYRLELVQYVVFDLLQLGGRSLLDRPLSERRALLQEHLPKLPCVCLCDGVVGAGKAFFQAAIAAGHEGVVAKRLKEQVRA